MKVVLNRKYGGFGLSQKALEKLKEQGWTVTSFLEDHSPIDRNADLLLKPTGTKFGFVDEGKLYINWWKHRVDTKEFRTRKEIVELIQQLGIESNDQHSSLVIQTANDDYYWSIHSYDGMENIKYGRLKDDYEIE